MFAPKPWLQEHSTVGCEVIFPHCPVPVQGSSSKTPPEKPALPHASSHAPTTSQLPPFLQMPVGEKYV